MTYCDDSMPRSSNFLSSSHLLVLAKHHGVHGFQVFVGLGKQEIIQGHTLISNQSCNKQQRHSFVGVRHVLNLNIGTHNWSWQCLYRGESMLQSTHTHSYMHICFGTSMHTCFKASTTQANNSHMEKLGHTIIPNTTTHMPQSS